MNAWKVSTVIATVALGASILYQSVPLAYAATPQPHMVEALRLLRAARAELDAAAPDKGGHREVAIARTNEAIDQTAKGVEYARGRPQ
jgi:hypothetical protein